MFRHFADLSKEVGVTQKGIVQVDGVVWRGQSFVNQVVQSCERRVYGDFRGTVDQGVDFRKLTAYGFFC